MFDFCMCWCAETDNRNDEQLSVCRTLLSSVYRPRESPATTGVCQSQQLIDKLRASLLRRFGMAEFTNLHGAIRGLVMTSYGADVARQRRLDSILASYEDAAVYFPLFFQLVQLEAILARDQ